MPETALGEVHRGRRCAATTGRPPKSRRCSANIRRCAISGTGDGPGKVRRSGPALAAARFPVIATMDGDGQNDPADIMLLAKRLGREGREPAMAAGIRAGRKGPGSRKAASRFANWIRDKVLADGCPDTGCGIKCLPREPFSSFPISRPCTAICRPSFSPTATKLPMRAVNDRPRLRGASKYTNLGRALIGLYDLVGVSWLRKRTQLPPVAETTGHPARRNERASATAAKS